MGRPPLTYPLRLWKLGLIAALFSVVFGNRAQARLQPYYVASGASLGELKPSVLFVLDTSNTMRIIAESQPAQHCVWDECETAGTPTESRISVARRTLHAVVEAFSDRAQFSLMTFHAMRPTVDADVPPRCSTGSGSQRFIWVHDYYPGNCCETDVEDIAHYPGYRGTWAICGDPTTGINNGYEKRPYPYIRRDQLGTGQVVDPSTNAKPLEPIPPSPLISTAEGDMKSLLNAARKVQWFPRFLGVRANINLTNDPKEETLRLTAGDYSPTGTLAEKQAEVQGWDFYYWPYVDGFPGYATFWGNTFDPSYVNTTGGQMGLGVHSGEGVLEAQLVAPFYVDHSTLAAAGLSTAEYGPASEADNEALILQLTDRLILGGVDAHSGGVTPWKSAIGDVPVTSTMDNSTFSHTTVASYLKFLQDADPNAICTPTTAILVTDGQPFPGSERHPLMFRRISELRKILGVKTYVIGIFQFIGTDLQDMACAAAGACEPPCDTPCDDTPAKNWDTCADPSDPVNGCAYFEDDADGLLATLTEILEGELALEVTSGQTALLTDSVTGGQAALTQSSLRAYTEWPSWKGHVVREACTDAEPHCQEADQFTVEQKDAPLWGDCPLSRTWDAGDCLAAKDPTTRRLYYRRPNGEVKSILDNTGTAATVAFVTDLRNRGLVEAGTPGTDDANAIALFIHGVDWPDKWRLPGIANSTPVMIRRIPPHAPTAHPAVPIRDPHCAGKNMLLTDDQVPDSLVQFAKDAYDPDLFRANPSPHSEYQEAVLVGDDLGMLHAFHALSGNEIWGFMPWAAVPGAVDQFREGPKHRGQPLSLDDHHYGLGSTVNQGFAYDPAAKKWRHLAVFGMGPGGKHYYVLDVSHMSPKSPAGPIEVLWSTEDALIAPNFDSLLGETWSRPALTYQVNDLTKEPEAFLVMTGGYGTDPEGRHIVLVNAMNGDIVESALLADGAIKDEIRYDTNAFGLVVDPAVVSHCQTKFWAEMQEVYSLDPAGRLFRWDLGHRGTPRDHESDSVQKWTGSGKMLAKLFACRGSGSTCVIKTTFASGGLREPIFFGPAISPLDRLDEFGASSTFDPEPDLPEQALLAFISGSTHEETLDPLAPGADFHSSIYMLVDDHGSDKRQGLSIPSTQEALTADKLDTYKGYARMVVSQIERTRTYTPPYAGAPTRTETRNFKAGTRPLRAPRIQVRSVIKGDEVLEGIEFFEITFVVYEPGDRDCDLDWYDPVAKEWHYDEGAVYEIKFDLPVSDTGGFNFQTGVNDPKLFGTQGLRLVSVEQITTDECADGNCAGHSPPPRSKPCEIEMYAPGTAPLESSSLSISASSIAGFTPSER